MSMQFETGLEIAKEGHATNEPPAIVMPSNETNEWRAAIQTLKWVCDAKEQQQQQSAVLEMRYSDTNQGKMHARVYYCRQWNIFHRYLQQFPSFSLSLLSRYMENSIDFLFANHQW